MSVFKQSLQVILISSLGGELQYLGCKGSGQWRVVLKNRAWCWVRPWPCFQILDRVSTASSVKWLDWVIMRNMLEPSVENCAYCGWERVVVYQDNHAIATIHIPWIKDHFASAKLMSTPPPVHSKITLKVNSWAYFLEDSEKIQKRANILIKNWSLFYFWSICCHISSMIP